MAFSATRVRDAGHGHIAPLAWAVAMVAASVDAEGTIFGGLEELRAASR